MLKIQEFKIYNGGGNSKTLRRVPSGGTIYQISYWTSDGALITAFCSIWWNSRKAHGIRAKVV